MFNRFFKVLEKTRNRLSDNIKSVLAGKNKIDDETEEELEELLISADVGVDTALEIIENLKKKIARIPDINDEKIVEALKSEIAGFFTAGEDEVIIGGAKPTVVLVVGVNGTGKTTTIAKIGNKLKKAGNTVMFAACDTFRAAAVEQLAKWGERTGIEVISGAEGADPSAVAYDAVESAVSKNCDYLIIDTAGRLHNKVNLMEELKKIKRTIQKIMPEAPHQSWMVLDAVTGQNGLMQADNFAKAIGLNGVIVAKLDGTAKGGIVLTVREKLGIPVRFIGTGEGLDDITEFSPDEFAKALIG